MFRLDDRVALVTGAARGVGATIARTLAAVGAKVVLTDILVEQGERAAAEIGDEARFESLDVTKEEDWTRAVNSTLGALGRIDVLVNNAAVLHMGSVDNTPPHVFRRLLEVNTVGPRHGHPWVFNITPILGRCVRMQLVCPIPGSETHRAPGVPSALRAA